jgi:hypothetical protein
VLSATAAISRSQLAVGAWMMMTAATLRAAVTRSSAHRRRPGCAGEALH